ncbi:hypothetical protein [Methylocucumis oryzae]|uniref:hypothetical protein n=1 Tax=Methylocucumis oryzae TaxID=1632867 RepID=UPI0012FEB27A|nr:hypothetical protein [Methylocucumis oryzae]
MCGVFVNYLTIIGGDEFYLPPLKIKKFESLEFLAFLESLDGLSNGAACTAQHTTQPG